MVKQIIKRVIVGVSVALILSVLRSKLFIQANALTIESLNTSNTVVNSCSSCNELYYHGGQTIKSQFITFDDFSLLQNGKYTINFDYTMIGSFANVGENYYLYTRLNGVASNQTFSSTSFSPYGAATVVCPDSSSGSEACTTSSATFTGTTAYLSQGGVPIVSFTWPSNSYSIRYFRINSYSINFIESQSGSDSSNVINNNNQNTTNIINNQNNNTNEIINNQNNNTDEIINNQNENTQKEIESQQVCNVIDKNTIVLDNSSLNTTGGIGASNSSGITDFYSTTGATLKVLNGVSYSTNFSLCFYNINKILISCTSNSNLSDGLNVSFPNNTSYFRATINKNNNLPSFNYCVNGNQALQNSLTDDSSVSNSDLNDLFSDFTESTTPVSDLITMPITLLQAYINGMSGTCSAYNLGSLYGTNLILPCIDLEEILGSNLWGIIDALFSIFMIYNFCMLCISIYEQFTSLDDGMQYLYSPQHSGHTRVSRNEGLY